jgi:hypothetical protein
MVSLDLERRAFLKRRLLSKLSLIVFCFALAGESSCFTLYVIPISLFSGASDGILGFWRAAIVIESLAWLTAEGLLGFLFYRLMTNLGQAGDSSGLPAIPGV